MRYTCMRFSFFDFISVHRWRTPIYFVLFFVFLSTDFTYFSSPFFFFRSNMKMSLLRHSRREWNEQQNHLLTEMKTESITNWEYLSSLLCWMILRNLNSIETDNSIQMHWFYMIDKTNEFLSEYQNTNNLKTITIQNCILYLQFLSIYIFMKCAIFCVQITHRNVSICLNALVN